jgi:type IV secretion system protein VirB10
MPVTEIGDPRLQALFGASDPRDAGARPVVRLPRHGLPTLAIVIGAIFLGILLFSALNARRTGQAEPSVRAGRADNSSAQFEAPPPLYIPSVAAPATAPGAADQRSRIATPLPPARVPAANEPRTVYIPQPTPELAPPVPAPAPPRTSAGAALVIDTKDPGEAGSVPAAGASDKGVPGYQVARVRASVLANRSMTVPQGFLIPAVLETGFDSTRPGFARAVVSRDVRGFDGKNVLIPRGSRLIGEYRSEVAQGQNRAMIKWTRLMRPDGMTIAMDSPAVDTLGRGGVPASVNGHFFQRLGDAFLQSVIGIGSALGQRSVTSPVVVVPGNAAATATGQFTPVTSYAPTLTVPAGKSISVFVAHDLDFSAAGASK